MLTMLKNWNGPVEVNGVSYNSISCITPEMLKNGEIHIVLHTSAQNGNIGTTDRQKAQVKEAPSKEVRITVKKYMTQQSNPGFDFMSKWNNDVPMPFRTMTGVKVKETPGMVYMKLHGDIWAEQIITCMKCGRVLSNPVSRYFGIGPECGGHKYINPFNSDSELKEAVAKYKEQLKNITWEGWIIKSAITECEEV